MPFFLHDLTKFVRAGKGCGTFRSVRLTLAVQKLFQFLEVFFSYEDKL